MKKHLSLFLAGLTLMGCLTACGTAAPTASDPTVSASDPTLSQPESTDSEAAGIPGMSAEALFTAYAAEPYSIPVVEGETADNTTVYTSFNNAGQRGADGCDYQISVDDNGNIVSASINMTGDPETLETTAFDYFAIAVLNPYDTTDEAGLTKWLKINLPNADEAGKYLVKGDARFDLYKTDADGVATYTLTIVKH